MSVVCSYLPLLVVHLHSQYASGWDHECDHEHGGEEQDEYSGKKEGRDGYEGLSSAGAPGGASEHQLTAAARYPDITAALQNLLSCKVSSWELLTERAAEGFAKEG
jgi:hypothetical protein